MTLKLVIETEQNCQITYHLTCEELLELYSLIKCKGQAIISGKYLTADSWYLNHYKGNEFSGAFYAMPIDGVLQKIKILLKEHCNY